VYSRPLGAILREALEESRAVLAREDWNIMDYSNIFIETVRLKIRPISFKYIKEIFDEFTSEICKYLIPQPSKNISEIRDFINLSICQVKNGITIQFELENKLDEFVGIVGVYKINTRNPELGLWIKTKEQNKGYGTEALNAIIEWINLNIEYDHLIYPIDKRNERSRKLIEKLNGKIADVHMNRNSNDIEFEEVEYWISK
jgi:ribosomal-protein-alanine N-acetyltransferase